MRFRLAVKKNSNDARAMTMRPPSCRTSASNTSATARLNPKWIVDCEQSRDRHLRQIRIGDDDGRVAVARIDGRGFGQGFALQGDLSFPPCQFAPHLPERERRQLPALFLFPPVTTRRYSPPGKLSWPASLQPERRGHPAPVPARADLPTCARRRWPPKLPDACRRLQPTSAPLLRRLQSALRLARRVSVAALHRRTP